MARNEAVRRVRKTGARYGVAFCGLGLLLAAGLLDLTGMWSVALDAFPGVAAVGAAAALVASAQLGWWAAPRIATASEIGAMGIGGLVAIASMELGALAGSLRQLFGDAGVHRAGLGATVISDVMAPMFWTSFAGLVPAAVLGICLGISLRTTLRSRAQPAAVEPGRGA